ncbi:hypothetical protein UFOVP1437_5 [uncultured Caudovirales phage]|uniref:Holin of 3TMs, for gene-transfer release n=1 Tax=uncultured Caudovirales phage TaxID=2100421 RepID=A0A6J5SDL7_9CAUD|nr:hypothetical protein UFOVP1437_5 [uncultured Caudovirales phage]CAB5228165.1 hypothetical protein UFOVP1531_59 [uncultured Caudovirales phage]
MGSILGGLISALGSIFGSFFSTKVKQGEVIGTAVEAISTLASSNAERERAAALVVAAEAQSDSWLARNWRPMTMAIFVGLIVARFFGLVPSHMSPAEYDRLWDLVEVGMGGYVVSRSVEKIVAGLNLSSVLKKYLDQLTLDKR